MRGQSNKEAAEEKSREPKIRRRSRVVQILLIPTTVFLMVVGWGLCWVGPRKGSVRQQRVRARQELAHFVAVSEDELEVEQKSRV